MSGHNGHGPPDLLQQFFKDLEQKEVVVAATTVAAPDSPTPQDASPAPRRGGLRDYFLGRVNSGDLDLIDRVTLPFVVILGVQLTLGALAALMALGFWLFPRFALAPMVFPFVALAAAFVASVPALRRRAAERAEAAAAHERIHGPAARRGLLRLLCDRYYGDAPHVSAGLLLSITVDLAAMAIAAPAVFLGIFLAAACVATPVVLACMLQPDVGGFLTPFVVAPLLTLASGRLTRLEERLSGRPASRWWWAALPVRAFEARQNFRHAMPDRPLAAVALDAAARLLALTASYSWALVGLVALILILSFRS